MNGHERFDEDVAAYALGALPDDDRRVFEAHLATCDACQHTLAELRRVSAAIGVSTEPAAPPVELRARTLARAAAQPQDRSRLAGTIGPSAASADLSGRAATRPSWFALAAALACIVGLGAYSWLLRSDLTSARELIAAMSARVETLSEQLTAARRDSATLTNTINVLRAPGMLRVDLKGQSAAPAAVGRAFISADKGLIFSAEEMPRLSANRTYQLWVITPENPSPISAGVFAADAGGTSMLTVPLPQGVTVVAAVAVSDEPSGGSPQPTTAPFLVGAVRN